MLEHEKIKNQDTEQEDSRLGLSFLMDLRDHMDQEEVSELNIETENENFSIKTKEQANFFIRKLQELREENEEVSETAKAELERLASKINSWRDSQLAANARTEAYFLGLLEQFADQELSGSSKKSLKLPFGTLAFKKQQDKYEYDENVLVDFLESNPKLKENFVSYKPSPKKAEIKKLATVINGQLFIDGVKIEGVTVTSQPEKFEVK